MSAHFVKLWTAAHTRKHLTKKKSIHDEQLAHSSRCSDKDYIVATLYPFWI